MLGKAKHFLASKSFADTALSDLYAGKQEGEAAAADARQLMDRARARRAEAGAQMREELRQGRLNRSRALAVAAASGGGADDVTVQNVIADLDTDARYRAMMAMYEGTEEAAGLNRAARNRLKEGKAARTVGFLGAARTALTGAETFKSRYG